MNYKVAKRYAKGLYDFASQTNETAVLYQEMTELQKLLSTSIELKNFLKSPIIDYRKKIKIIDEIFKTNSQSFTKFIKLVINHGREANLIEIANQFIAIIDEEQNIQKGVLLSAIAFDKETIDKIVNESNLVDLSKPISIENKIDENLIGGYILRMSDKQLDASIKTKLHKLRKEFDVNDYISKY